METRQILSQQWWASTDTLFSFINKICSDKRKQACLNRIQAAEHALGLHLHNVNMQALTSTWVRLRMVWCAITTQAYKFTLTYNSLDQPSASARLSDGASLEVKKELVEPKNFGSRESGVEGSTRENAMDVDAMLAEQWVPIINCMFLSNKYWIGH